MTKKKGDRRMKKITLIIIIATGITFAQTVYDVQPGTKGNEIKLTVANISGITPAEGVEVKLIKSSSSISFNKESESIELINANKESDVLFTFDISRNVQVNKKDTVEFMISDLNGMMIMKQFIFNYTGPKEYSLEQNYPNPFNPGTTIRYEIPGQARNDNMRITLKVYDVLGRDVATLVNEEQPAGFYEVKFDAAALASGMYIYRLTAGRFSSVKKMLLVK